MPCLPLRNQCDGECGGAVASELRRTLPADVGAARSGVATGAADDGEGVVGVVGWGCRSRAHEGAVRQVEGVHLEAGGTVRTRVSWHCQPEVGGVEVAHPFTVG